jgi:hypothetical protein
MIRNILMAFVVLAALVTTATVTVSPSHACDIQDPSCTP